MIFRICVATSLLLAVVGAGCATSKPVSGTVPARTSDYEAQLRGMVQQHMAKANQEQDRQKNEVIKRHPYFCKEYSVYDNPGQPFDVVMHKTESRMRPYLADVKLSKTRYATRLVRKAKEAKADTSFFRDMGQETLTYQWRNDQWKKVGSLFVTEKTEELVNGEWVPRREEIKRLYAEEDESEGWWVWNKIKKFFHRD